MSSEAAAKPLPQRGRIWVVILLAMGLVALSYAIVKIATQREDKGIVHVAGISEAQELFGGVPQEGDRLGSNDAPVTIQVFNDIQCSSCRDDFLGTVPGLMEAYVRPGHVKLLYRHYSNAETAQELGFYGAEAAAEQGYGWQYIYLFFRSQEEAKRFRTPKLFEGFEKSIAGGVEELEFEEWKQALEEAKVSGSAIQKRLEGYEELGRDLGIRYGQAMIVNGPNGTKTLQEGPSLAEVKRAIAAVE
ncbi:MAG TPA: thioredoxin domain-containing protein [Solirubrobacterales bacterium]|nr:thioredoxin domain-containing protein [Solirubrobacterales bacterium]